MSVLKIFSREKLHKLTEFIEQNVNWLDAFSRNGRQNRRFQSGTKLPILKWDKVANFEMRQSRRQYKSAVFSVFAKIKASWPKFW